MYNIYITNNDVRDKGENDDDSDDDVCFPFIVMFLWSKHAHLI